MAQIEFNPAVLLNDARARVARGVEAVAKGSEEFMAELISTKFPPASLAGYPPHLRTGYLKSRCYSIPYSATMKRITWRVGNDAEYANMLEDGTENMASRPFIRPTFYQYAMAKGQEVFMAAAAD